MYTQKHSLQGDVKKCPEFNYTMALLSSLENDAEAVEAKGLFCIQLSSKFPWASTAACRAQAAAAFRIFGSVRCRNIYELKFLW